MEELFIKSILIIVLILIACLVARWLNNAKSPREVLVLIIIALGITVFAGSNKIGVLPAVVIAFLIVKAGAWVENHFQRTSGT